MKNQYVILTGGKNNAGDFLIKYRAKQLLADLRPDRTLLDLNGWEPLDASKLEEVNNSKALLLVGGPALQFDMYPHVYALMPNLNDIKVPVITMGVGYKDQNGSWERTASYLLSEKTKKLLDKIENSGYQSGVRDYHSLNMLLHKGYKSFIMTGCPALYDKAFIGKEYTPPAEIKKIRFSLGVSYQENSSMFKQMQEVICDLKNIFPDSDFKVLFHHKIKLAIPSQKQMTNWMAENKIAYADISGSETEMLKEYTSCDLHVGYRVHAHIYMNSISRPSVLLNEDSRGKGLYGVIGGVNMDAYQILGSTLKKRVWSKLGVKTATLTSVSGFSKDLIANLKYELETQMPRIQLPRKNIDFYYKIMSDFIQKLP